tara:strand:- start:407 stop:910 length:504 start_codon:yes stop_codon:yes gene_type:complete
MIHTHIYYLHRGDNKPLYIGKALNTHRRLLEHRCHRKDYDLCIEIIDTVIDWKYWEEFYIELFTSWGFVLDNKSNKGRGPGPRPNTWGDKISKSLKGNKYSSKQKSNCRNGKRKTYYQYDKNGTFIKEWFATGTQIGEHFNKCGTGFTKCLLGKQKSAYGFIWRTKE